MSYQRPDNKSVKRLGSFMHIELDDPRLQTGSEYQRPTNKSRVRKLVTDWADEKCGVIMLASRGGKFSVVDGQHRLAALRELSRSNARYAEVLAPCMVVKYEAEKDEAEAFDGINNDRRQVAGADTHHARLVGENPENIEVENLVRKHGYYLSPRWNLSSLSEESKKIGAPTSILKLVTTLDKNYGRGRGLHILDATIGVIDATWMKSGKYTLSTAFNNHNIKAIATFIALCDGREAFVPEELINTMEMYSPNDLQAEIAKISTSKNPSAAVGATALSKLYNKANRRRISVNAAP